MPDVVLMLMADHVRLRHARRLLSTTSIPALFAVEREAVLAKPRHRIWSPSAVGASLDLRYVLDRLEPGGELPVETEPQRANLPADVAIEGPEWGISDPMLPFMLKSAEKRALDAISDWPWIALGDLAGLLGVSPQRASQLVNPLEGLDLPARPRDAGGRLAVTDRGLALLSRRDRTSVALARKRWSVSLEDADAPLEWRNVSGSRSRQLLRNMEHTGAVHAFVGALARPGPPAGVGGRADRPAPEGVEALQARGRDALRQPRRLRRPQTPARCDLGLLPGMGETRRAPLDHVAATRPLSTLLLISQTHRRSRHAARGPGRLRRRDRTDPLPARGAGGDAGGGRGGAPVGVPQGGCRSIGATGTRMARPGRLGVATGPDAPMNERGRRREREPHGRSRIHLPQETEWE